MSLDQVTQAALHQTQVSHLELCSTDLESADATAALQSLALQSD